MFVFLVSIHIVVCIWLIVIVLLQAGKGGGLSGLFGGGSAP
ncbi:MAG: preprotein translocase subunit SecG, partial [bacterium]|nr:preprotein translocase subunit SecG [bacterium]